MRQRRWDGNDCLRLVMKFFHTCSMIESHQITSVESAQVYLIVLDCVVHSLLPSNLEV
jgi:hypothetical protein